MSGIDLKLKELKQITAHCGFSKKSENMATVEHLQISWYGRVFLCVCVLNINLQKGQWMKISQCLAHFTYSYVMYY